MKQSCSLTLSMLTVLMTFSNSANATVAGWGAATRNTTFSSCPSVCTNPSTVEDGGEGSLSAAATENTYGISRGEVHLNNPASTYLPILRADSVASTAGGARAAVAGVQGFVYNGASPTTITLNLNLDAFLDRTAPGTPEAFARTDVAVFRTNSLLPFLNDYSSVRFEIGSGSFINGAESSMIANMALGVQGIVSMTDTISFDVMPGDEFVVWAGLRTFTERGGVADVFNTFSLTFEDDTGLTASGAPEAPVGGLDHFKCYKAHGHDNLDVTVHLENQFGATTADIEEPELFCNPVAPTCR